VGERINFISKLLLVTNNSNKLPIKDNPILVIIKIKIFTMTKILALVALLGSTMAASSLKHRLAQTTPPAETPVLDCDCTLPGLPGAGFPNMTEGSYNSFGSGASISSAASVVTVPDTEWAS
jgi:hypothetical protein